MPIATATWAKMSLKMWMRFLQFTYFVKWNATLSELHSWDLEPYPNSEIQQENFVVAYLRPLQRTPEIRHFTSFRLLSHGNARISTGWKFVRLVVLFTRNHLTRTKLKTASRSKSRMNWAKIKYQAVPFEQSSRSKIRPVFCEHPTTWHADDHKCINF